jgi:hypothetical protein
MPGGGWALQGEGGHSRGRVGTPGGAFGTPGGRDYHEAVNGQLLDNMSGMETRPTTLKTDDTDTDADTDRAPRVGTVGAVMKPRLRSNGIETETSLLQGILWLRICGLIETGSIFIIINFRETPVYASGKKNRGSPAACHNHGAVYLWIRQRKRLPSLLYWTINPAFFWDLSFTGFSGGLILMST